MGTRGSADSALGCVVDRDRGSASGGDPQLGIRDLVDVGICRDYLSYQTLVLVLRRAARIAVSQATAILGNWSRVFGRDLRPSDDCARYSYRNSKGCRKLGTPRSLLRPRTEYPPICRLPLKIQVADLIAISLRRKRARGNRRNPSREDGKQSSRIPHSRHLNWSWKGSRRAFRSRM